MTKWKIDRLRHSKHVDENGTHRVLELVFLGPDAQEQYIHLNLDNPERVEVL